MNKYSKAVKTAATVGMSLAMVLSAVPATQIAAKDYEVCSLNEDEKEYFKNVQKATEDLIDAVGGLKGLSEIKADAKFKFNGEKDTVKGHLDSTTGQWNAESNHSLSVELDWIFEKKAACATAEMEALHNYVKGIDALNGLVDDAKELLENTDWETISKKDKAYNKAYKALNALTEGDYAGYAVNLADDYKDLYDRVVSDLEEVLSEFGYDAEVLKNYVEQVEKVYEILVNGTTELDGNFISKDAVEEAIEAITKGEIKNTPYARLKLLTPINFKRYSEEADEVQDVLNELEAMYDEIEEVKDALNKARNEAYKAFVKNPAGDDSVKIKVENAIKSKEYKTDLDALMDALTVSEYETYKTFKEEIIDVLVTMKSDTVGKRLYDDTEKSMFADKDVVESYMKLANKAIFAYYEKDDMFGWDYYVEHMETVKSSLEIVENELPKLDSINLKASDRDAILAGRDAVDYLEGSTANLTAKENKAVKAAANKVDELIFTYRTKFGSLNVTTGWQNAGNGNWKFYEEDGTAPTKWIASGKDWFYVKDGAMLRNAWVAKDAKGDVWYYVGDNGAMVTNTTIDGCYINSLGIWTK